MRMEYTVERVSPDSIDEFDEFSKLNKLERLLNSLGMEHWELVSAVLDPQGYHILYFQRPLGS